MPQYSGAHYYTQFNGGATRTELADNLKAALVAAGFSVASGSSGDWKLDSQITVNGLQFRARVYDPGSGPYASVICSLVDDTLPLNSIPCLLAFNAAETWEFYGNPFFATMQVLPWAGVSSKAAMFGTGWTPDFFHDASPNECVAVVFQHYFPAGYKSMFGGSTVGFRTALFGAIWNAQKFEENSTTDFVAQPNIPVFPPNFVVGGQRPLRWAVDDSYHILDPLLEFSLVAGLGDTASARVRMQFFDMIVVHGDGYEAGDEIQWDGYVWRCVNHLNSIAGLFCLKQAI